MTAKASVAIGAGRLDLDARETGRDFNATAKLAGVDVATLDQDFAGRIDADLSLTGHDRALSGTLTAHLAQARVSDASAKLAMDGDLRATLAGSQLDITATAVNGAGGRASANLALPAEAGAAPFRIAVAQTRPMSGQFNVQGEIEPIYELFFGGERSLGGQVAAQGQIAGTMNSPDITGHATLTAGHFEDSATGLKLRNVAADADFNRGALVLHSFSGTDAARGAVSGDGELDLAKGGASNLVLTLRGFQLIDNETAKAVATGQLTLARDAAGKAKLAGSLVIDSAVISAQTSRAPPGVVHMDVVERNRPAALDKGVQVQSADRGISVALDIRLRSASGVTVRGLGLNAQMSLDALVAGDTARPLLSGTAHVVRGDYQFAGQRFEIDNRGVVDLATSPDQIRLDLSATREDPSLTAIISIKGTAAKPVITLSSSPSLPNDEILAQVLFGRSAAQLSPVEAAELAAAVTTLATGGGFDVMGGLQNFARLDRLALGGDSASGITVSGGKYIGKNVYLELTGGGRSGPSAEVEVRAGRGLSVVSQVGGLSGAKIAIRWRRDYGRATDATKH
ncbi:MAG TPA: translocation/assembly module TamB domain-containing protein, partial [Caulobacteraceae bacterium]|nr:translocation/assembly module TamB domain-containing protein [Caulobacteraceae bacterium]